MLLSISLPLFSADDLPLLNLKGGTICVKQLAVELDISTYFTRKTSDNKKICFLIEKGPELVLFSFFKN